MSMSGLSTDALKMVENNQSYLAAAALAAPIKVTDYELRSMQNRRFPDASRKALEYFDLSGMASRSQGQASSKPSNGR